MNASIFTPIQNMASGLKISYDNLKIKHKLFVVHFLIVLIVCSVSLVALQIALNIYDGLLYNESAKVLNLSTISIENELKQVEKFSYAIISNPGIQNNLETLKTDRTPLERSKIGSDLTDSLWVYVFERNITSVNLIDTRGNQYSGGPVISEAAVGRIVPMAAKKEGMMLFLKPDSDETILIGARQVRGIRNLSLEPLGTLIIQIKIGELVKQCTLGPANYEVNLLILSGKKEVYHSNRLAGIIGKTFHFQGDIGYRVHKVGGQNFFVAHTQSAFTGWTYVNILPYETVFKQVILMRTIVLLIFLMLFLCTVLISMKLAQNLTSPIEKLTAKMKRVENGEFEIGELRNPQTQRADEIGDLQRDFVIMIQKINTLIKEDYTKQIVIKEAQFKALQAQINPHFLYNTLESINWLAKINHQQDISMMVESLGNLLRNTISSKEPVITIKEEILLLKDYITIQTIRFGERLEFEMDIDERWQELSIPKLTLQPIVENAINYGLEKMLAVCRITVKAIPWPDFLEIVIEDNGPGIDSAILEKLATGEIKPKGLGVGLNNINDRIKHLFGEGYGIHITSELDKGSRVTIRIPKTGAEND